MTDVFSKERRSEVMASIRSKGTGLDEAMNEILSRSGLPFERYPDLFGKPDFLVGSSVAVFCDSSFWHGREWGRLRERLRRGGNATYWIGHIGKNRRRDALVTRRLRASGFTVLRFWDSDVYGRPQWCVSKVRRALAKSPAKRKKRFPACRLGREIRSCGRVP